MIEDDGYAARELDSRVGKCTRERTRFDVWLAAKGEHGIVAVAQAVEQGGVLRGSLYARWKNENGAGRRLKGSQCTRNGVGRRKHFYGGPEGAFQRGLPVCKPGAIGSAGKYLKSGERHHVLHGTEQICRASGMGDDGKVGFGRVPLRIVGELHQVRVDEDGAERGFPE